VIQGFIVGGRRVWKWFTKNWWRLWWAIHLASLRFRAFFREIWGSDGLRSISCEFCAELAVLVAVFPLLDVLIHNNEIRPDPKAGITVRPISLLTVFGSSLAIVLSSLLVAVILKNKEK
jgi:hypothetical protein